MTIEKLKSFPQEPIPPRPVTPRCHAVVSVMSDREREWRLKRHGQSGGPFQCVRPSIVRIGDKHYCRLHGGHVVLDMVLRGELIENPAKQERAGR